MQPVTGGRLWGPGQPGKPEVASVGGPDGDARSRVARRGETGDRLELSQAATELARLRDLLRSLPEVRHARVAMVQRLVQEGRYQVPAQEVADRLIREAGESVAASSET